MAEPIVHRCLVCDPGHHAHLWRLWADATAADVAAAAHTALGRYPSSVRLATEAEAERLLDHVDVARPLWISQHPFR